MTAVETLVPITLCTPRAKPSRRPTQPRGLVETWLWRIRYRFELQEKAKGDPHFIADIGLKRHEVEAEVGKPFWKR
jgi:uncharacterized protein YjiS (DUF1127 family)